MSENWLAEDLAEAPSDYAMSLPREVAKCPPLAPEDADRLRRKMVARYREWTGRDLFSELLTRGEGR